MVDAFATYPAVKDEGVLVDDNVIEIDFAGAGVVATLVSPRKILVTIPGGAGSAITALTGDGTATGPGSVTFTISNGAVNNAKIANNAVTYSKMQLMSASKLLMNASLSANVPMEIAWDATLQYDSGTGKFGRAHIQSGDVDIPSGSNVALVTGFRGTALAVGNPNHGQGYVYLFNSTYNLVDINFLYDQSRTNVTVSSVNNTEQTIYTNNLSTGLLAVIGQSLNFEFAFTFNNTTDVNFYFGSAVTPIFSFSTTAPVATTSKGICRIKVIYLSNTTAEATIEVIAGQTQNAATAAFYHVDSANISGLNFSGSSITWRLSGKSTAALSTNSLTSLYYRLNFGA